MSYYRFVLKLSRPAKRPPSWNKTQLPSEEKTEAARRGPSLQQLGALRRTEQGALALRGDDWRGGVLLIRFEEEEEEEEEEVSVCFRVCVCLFSCGMFLCPDVAYAVVPYS